MDKLQQEVRVPVVTEAVYELCPNDPDMAPYFEIEDPSEQSRVMHRLLTDTTSISLRSRVVPGMHMDFPSLLRRVLTDSHIHFISLKGGA